MGVSWPGLRIGAPPTHYSLLLPVGHVKTQFPSPRTVWLRALECFSRPELGVGLEDVNSQTLLVLAKAAFPSVTLKPDKGSTEGSALTLQSPACRRHRCVFKLLDNCSGFYNYPHGASCDQDVGPCWKLDHNLDCVHQMTER